MGGSQVSTRYYVTNQGLKNQAGESLEKAYVELCVDNNAINIYEWEEYIDLDISDLWECLESAGYDFAELSQDIDFDPFTPTIKK